MRVISFLIIGLLSACGNIDMRPDNKDEWLSYGILQINKEHYQEGLSSIKAWQQEFPVDSRNRDAYLQLIYVSFLMENYQIAISYAKRFQELYLNDEMLDYVMFVEGLANYERNRPSYEDYVFTDISQRDPGAMVNAFFIFKDLVIKYPNSIYAWDAYRRMIFINERLAERELKAMKFYYKKELYVSALSRAYYLIENFSNTKYFEYALATVSLCAQHMNDKELADKYARILAMYNKDFKLPEGFFSYE